MLIQQFTKLSEKSRLVNIALACAVTLTLGLTTPVSAQAWENSQVSKEVLKVKFSRAELSSPEGLSTIYLRLEKKAKRACRLGQNLDETGALISKSACTENLLSQFVESADIDILTAYHKKYQSMMQST